MEQKCESSQVGDQHCWHVTRIVGASKHEPGIEYYECCWCGDERLRRYRLVPDPAHGLKHPQYQRVFEDGLPPADGPYPR